MAEREDGARLAAKFVTCLKRSAMKSVVGSPALCQSSPSWAEVTAELDELQETGRWLPGPATMLDVLERSDFEADHERLVAWLLNPRCAHNLGPAVLGAMLERLRRQSAIVGAATPADLSRARVRTQVVRASSRPDIVVEMPARTLVVELKIHSAEGFEQTTRQADDYANVPGVLLVFLTLHDRAPGDPRFVHMRLRDFAEDLRQVLEGARELASPAAIRSRAVAADYLATLERMLGMDPVDQVAARFWLRHGRSMEEAEQAARKLLRQLPDVAHRALESVAPDLGPDLVVSEIEYTARGRDRKDYPERAVLLARKRWLRPDGTIRVGIGMAQSADYPDPHDGWHSPFCGIWASDHVVRARLHERWGTEKPWEPWARWRYLDLEPPSDQTADLLEHYANEIIAQVRLDWREAGILDEVVDSGAQ